MAFNDVDMQNRAGDLFRAMVRECLHVNGKGLVVRKLGVAKATLTRVASWKGCFMFVASGL